MNTNKGKKLNFVVYKITNLLDGRVYVGVHKTYNVNDKYMGSSKHLKKDLKKLGRENFKKEILFVFDNKEDMLFKEAEIVNREWCHRPDTYNRVTGGKKELYNSDMVCVRDKNGDCMLVYIDDPRYLSGELVHNMVGKKTPEETLEKKRLAMLGKKQKQSTKEKISKSLKKAYDNGEINKTIILTEEQKKRRSERRLKEVENGLDKKCKKVLQYNKEGKLLKEFNSIGEAARETETNKHQIILVAKGKGKTANGFKWSYK